MKKSALSVGVIVLSLAGAACNDASDVATVDDSTDTTMTTGTSGAETAAPAAQQPVEAQQTELPATASPLPLIAGLGVLAVAGAAGLRMLR